MSSIENIEILLLNEFEKVPFHNLFMLNKRSTLASELGGTCSDKVLHFRKVLCENGIDARLNSAFINGFECHRMLSVIIDNRKYFLDVGSGWPSINLFPAFEAIEYSAYGMFFKTILFEDHILLYHKTNKQYKLMTTIPIHQKNETAILTEISKRFNDISIYPFQNSLRFSLVIDNSFYFIKGNRLRIYNKNLITDKILTEPEVFNLINGTFKFNLNNLIYQFFYNEKAC